MQARISLSKTVRQSLHAQWEQALRAGDRKLSKRICALLFLEQGCSVEEVSCALSMGEQTVRDALKAFMLEGIKGLGSKRRPGRPPKLTKTQREELAKLIEAGPEAQGYASACWSATMIAELIERRFEVSYHPHYVSQLLHNLGFSFQKARFVSDHLSPAAREEWKSVTWPRIIALAKEKKGRILFGDEASFAQWGSLSYTWARRGVQPTVKTSGIRRALKVFGLIDAVSGDFLFKPQEERFNSQTYQAFLLEVFDVVPEHIILIHDQARYHTSASMKQFYANHHQRLSVVPLPAYSPDFNPIEFLWKKVKKRSTHLRHFSDFQALASKVDDALFHFSRTPSEITSLLGQYCESLAQLTAA